MMSQDSSPQPSEEQLSDVLIDPMMSIDDATSAFEQSEFNFEFSDHNYRCVC